MRPIKILTAILWLTVLGPVPAQPPVKSGGVEGFLEPYRTIDIAASEPGLLDTLLVEEGARVAAGDVVAELQNDVLEAALGIARQTSQSRGKLNSAQSELKLTETMLRKLTELQGRGIATSQEVERAQVEHDVAAARLLTVEEELAIRKLEAERIQQEIEVRRLRSPIAGIVTKQWKDAGEYVAPGDPIVLTVVQLDPLTAVFSVPPAVLPRLQPGGVVEALIGESGVPVSGIVEFISPLIDPRSGTVQVKVRVPNPDGSFRSGERCLLQVLPATTPTVASPLQSAPVN